MTPTRIIAVAAATALASTAYADHIDGSLTTGAYSGPLFVQDTPTSFGDNSNTSTTVANGSEIDGVYGYVADGALTLLVTGNVETNFNRLILFVDSVAGGDNVVGTSSTDTSSGGGTLNSYNGLTFDSGFNADYFFSVNGGGDPTQFYVDYATLGGTGVYLGSTDANAQTATLGNNVVFGYDNSNVAGVTDALAAGAGAVTTGFEFSIPLAALGDPTGDIRIAGFIAGGDFLSNQVFGGVSGAGSLGSAGSVNFANIAGDQFVVVSQAAIPEPGTAGLLAVAGLGLIARRRRA